MHVRRRQDGGDDEGDHDEIAPLFAQLFEVTMPIRPSSVRITGSWNAMPKAKISDIISDRYSPTLGNSWICARLLAAHLLHAEREPHQHRHHDEIDQHRAEHEEQRGRDQIGQERVALVLVEAGRHEFVDLRRHDRERDEGGAEQRQLQLREEIFQQRRVDEFRILRPRRSRRTATPARCRSAWRRRSRR